MGPITKSQIDLARNYFREHALYPEIQTAINGIALDYFIFPQSLKPDIPNFVYSLVSDDRQSYLFGVSDSLREDFRRYFVFHEYVEFIELEKDSKDSCLKALEKEIMLVPRNLLSDYLTIRKEFFEALINSAIINSDMYPRQDIQKYQKSKQRIDQMLDMITSKAF